MEVMGSDLPKPDLTVDRQPLIVEHMTEKPSSPSILMGPTTILSLDDFSALSTIKTTTNRGYSEIYVKHQAPRDRGRST